MEWAGTLLIPFLVEIQTLTFDLQTFVLSKVTAVLRREDDSANLFTEIYYDQHDNRSKQTRNLLGLVGEFMRLKIRWG